MSMWIVLYLSVGLVAWPFAVGMFFHDAQGRRPTIAAKTLRTDIGFAVAVGFLYSMLWPVLLPLAYCLTGFAEHGILRQK